MKRIENNAMCCVANAKKPGTHCDITILVTSKNMSQKVQPNQCSATLFPKFAECFVQKAIPGYTCDSYLFQSRRQFLNMFCHHFKQKVARLFTCSGDETHLKMSCSEKSWYGYMLWQNAVAEVLRQSTRTIRRIGCTKFPGKHLVL